MAFLFGKHVKRAQGEAHRTLRRSWLGALLGGALAAGLGVAGIAQAQSDYPNRPIRLVVPFPAGESIDAIARLVSEGWAKKLGQSIVIENRPGAAGLIGSETVAKAAPDGYTLLLGNVGGLGILPVLRKDMPYDVLQDFAPISQVSNVPFFMFISSTLPMTSVQEVIDYAKANPGELNFASTGVGSGVHLAGELFKRVADVDVVHVAYKGVGQALPELINGNVHFVFYPVTFLPQVRAGHLRPLAIAAANRSSALPDVPTTVEIGMPDLQAGSWHALMAPAGTPQPILEKLHATLAEVLAEPEVRAKMLDLGVEPVGSSPAELDTFIRRELDTWRTVVEASGLQID